MASHNRQPPKWRQYKEEEEENAISVKSFILERRFYKLTEFKKYKEGSFNAPWIFHFTNLSQTMATGNVSLSSIF